MPSSRGGDPNLHIAYKQNPAGGGRTVYTCRSHGCEEAEILDALELSKDDLFDQAGEENKPRAKKEKAKEDVPLFQLPTKKREKDIPPGPSKVVDTFPFTDTTGRELYYIELRLPGQRWVAGKDGAKGHNELTGSRKSLHFRRKLPDGKVISNPFTNKEHTPPPHTVYNAVGVARAVVDGERIWLTEGMAGAKRLMDDYEAVATSLDRGATGSKFTPYVTGQFSGATELCMVFDLDDEGVKLAREVMARLGPVVGKLRMFHAATGFRGDDVVDHLDAGLGLDDLVEVPLGALRTPEESAKATDGKPGGTGKRYLELTWCSEIEPEPVVWALKLESFGVIPAAMVSLVAGREGTGKSTFLAWLVAHITRGTLPGAFEGRPRRVLYIATEDSYKHTIVPRLIAAGADMSMVARVEAVTEEGQYGTLTLPADTSLLKDAIIEHDVALVCLDPLLSTLDAGINTNTEHQVRQALDPIARLAQDTGIVFACIVHFNKSGGTDAASLIQNSGAFKNITRCILGFAKNKIDGEDEEDEPGGAPRIERVMAVVKLSVGNEDQPVRTYTLEPVEIPTKKGTAETTKFGFTGFSDLTMEEVLAAANAKKGRSETPGDSTDKVIAWLRGYLTEKGGSADSSQIKAAAQMEGFAQRTVERLRKVAGVEVTRSGFGGTTTWTLVEQTAPENKEESSAESEEETTQENAESDHSRHLRHPRHATETPDGGADGVEARETSAEKHGARHQSRHAPCLSPRGVDGADGATVAGNENTEVFSWTPPAGMYPQALTDPAVREAAVKALTHWAAALEAGEHPAVSGTCTRCRESARLSAHHNVCAPCMRAFVAELSALGWPGQEQQDAPEPVVGEEEPVVESAVNEPEPTMPQEPVVESEPPVVVVKESTVTAAPELPEQPKKRGRGRPRVALPVSDAEIARRVADGTPVTQLAQEYGISWDIVSRARKRGEKAPATTA